MGVEVDQKGHTLHSGAEGCMVGAGDQLSLVGGGSGEWCKSNFSWSYSTLNYANSTPIWQCHSQNKTRALF